MIGLEVCGSSGIAKLVLPDLAQDFTTLGTTHIGFCEHFRTILGVFSTFYPHSTAAHVEASSLIPSVFLNLNEFKPCLIMSASAFLDDGACLSSTSTTSILIYFNQYYA